MNNTEATKQAARIARFRHLEGVRDHTRFLYRSVTEPDPKGPRGKNAFTGDTRESRMVRRLQIDFTATDGGAAPVSLDLVDLFIPASELGVLLERLLRANVERVEKEMAEL